MAGTNILVVEDQRAVAGALRMRLRGLGYDVMAIATDGKEAIEKAGELRPDLILMDIRLGEGMDGIEAAHRIRAEYDIPVVYVSAYADRELLDRAKETHPAGFINKPFTTKDLLTTINLALDQASSRDAPEEIDVTARDAVLTTDVEGNVTFISHGAEVLTGWSREAIVGKPLDAALTTLYGLPSEEARRILNDVLTTGQEHSLTRRKGVSHRAVTDILTPLRDAQGNHFGVALRFGPDTVHTSVAALQRTVDTFGFVIDQCPFGVVVVDRNLRIAHVNIRSHAIVEANPGILTVQSHLVAVSDAHHTEVQALVRRAVERGEAQNRQSELLSLPDAADERRITIVATPSPVSAPPGPASGGAVLFLFDPASKGALSAPALRQLFGLTRSEARLVQSIVGGSSLEDGAQSLGISVNTARTHLKHVFHKTGAKRQSELIHQVETSPAALPLEFVDRKPPSRSH